MNRLFAGAPALALSLLLATTAPTLAQTKAKKPAATPKPAAPAAKASAKVVTPAAKAAPGVDRAAVEAKARAMTENLNAALHLAPAQLPKVQQINANAIEDVEVARRELGKEPRQLRQRLELIDQSRLSLLKDVLTVQQFQAYVNMRAQKMGLPAEAANPQGPGGAAGSGVQLPPGAE